MEFYQAVIHILAAEGGYSNNPKDPGGETKYGITQRTARAHGYKGAMRELPLSVAQAIYRESYWDACRCDELPPAIRLAVFDAAVNSGPAQSILWLQRCLMVTANGVVNKATLAAAQRMDAGELVNMLLNRRLDFLRQLRTWPTFGKGWTARIEQIRRLSQSFREPLPVGVPAPPPATTPSPNLFPH